MSLVNNKWKHNVSACYVTDDNQVKPNVSAPFVVEIPNISEVKMGTSYSAPIVTACIALLMESDSDYSFCPDMVISTVTATARKTSDYSENSGYFYSKVGSGIVDFENMISNNTFVVGWGNTNLTAGYQVSNKNVYLSSGTEIQIGMAWLASADATETSNYITINNIYLTNYDLYLYDPSGTLVASSTFTNSNVELIRYTATNSGTYKMVVYQSSARTSTIPAETIYLTYQKIYS